MIHLQETAVWRKPAHWEDDYVYVDEKQCEAQIFCLTNPWWAWIIPTSTEGLTNLPIMF